MLLNELTEAFARDFVLVTRDVVRKHDLKNIFILKLKVQNGTQNKFNFFPLLNLCFVPSYLFRKKKNLSIEMITDVKKKFCNAELSQVKKQKLKKNK